MSITANNLKVREVINQVVNDPDYREVSSIPLFSYHQLGLIVLAWSGVLGGIALHLFAGVSLWIVYPVMIFCFYTAFTPLHDATHRALSSNKSLNDLLGTISASILLPFATTAVYRYLHLSHHRYVGDKDWDPDDNLVVVPTKYFPFGYLILFFPDVLWLYWIIFKSGKRTPTRTRNATLFMFFGLALFNIAWFASPFWLEYLLIFFIPNRLGIFCVAYSFAHIQHPEGLQWNEFPFQTTYKLKGNRYLLKSLYGQANHAMHHFLPHIPWYKYHSAWNLANGVFQRQQIPERGMFTAPDREYKAKVLKNAEAEADSHRQVSVVSVEDTAVGIKTFVFEPAVPGEDLPGFSAGSHINITLPSGLVRPYSLVNPPYEHNKYQIAVKLEPNGRGGSKEMHEAVSAGDILKISTPRNNFLLYENAAKHILIAGGIGVTPMLSMAHQLTESDKHFELHICAKAEEEIPFLYELKNWTFAPNVEIHLDNKGKSSMELSRVLASPGKDTLVYICGPSGFNTWVRETALDIGWQREQIKEELFSIDNANFSEPKAFELILKKSGRSIRVEKDATVIDALHHQNINVEYSCLQGTCGTCITPVVEGMIDHRDAVMSSWKKSWRIIKCAYAFPGHWTIDWLLTCKGQRHNKAELQARDRPPNICNFLSDKQLEQPGFTGMSIVKTYHQVHRSDNTASFGISRTEDIYDRRSGAVDEPHRHDYYTVLLIRSAKGRHIIDFNEYPLQNRQVFFISPGQVHQVIEDRRSIGYSMVFSDEFLVINNIPAAFIANLKLFNNYDASPPLEPDAAEFEKLSRFAEEMLACQGSEDKLRDEAIGSWLKLLLIQCNNLCSLEESNTQLVEAGSSILADFKQLVEDNYTSWHQSSEYAAKLHVTPDHLNRVVKSMIGKTAKEYIQSRITTAAKRMLYFSGSTAKEIGYTLGFSEPANFSAFFKNCTGMSPTQFRKSA